METGKQLAVAGVLGLVIGIVVYIFMKIQARTELREKAKWKEDNSNLSPIDLEAASQSKYGRRIFPGISNKFLYSLIIVMGLVFALTEFGFLNQN